MKTYPSLVAAAALVTAAFAVSAPPEEAELVKITEKRIPMDRRLMTLCVGPGAVVGPHAAAEVDVYVNDIVLSYRKKNPDSFDYPTGSKFVKTKYPVAGAKEPDIATTMIKTGDDGRVSDWEFSMESLPDHKPIRHDARVSCASCHERYEVRGYISSESEQALRQHLRLSDEIEPDSADDSAPPESNAVKPK